MCKPHVVIMWHAPTFPTPAFLPECQCRCDPAAATHGADACPATLWRRGQGRAHCLYTQRAAAQGAGNASRDTLQRCWPPYWPGVNCELRFWRTLCGCSSQAQKSATTTAKVIAAALVHRHPLLYFESEGKSSGCSFGAQLRPSLSLPLLQQVLQHAAPELHPTSLIPRTRAKLAAVAVLRMKLPLIPHVTTHACHRSCCLTWPPAPPSAAPPLHSPPLQLQLCCEGGKCKVIKQCDWFNS
jgi:hypothetical protein